MPHTGVHTGVNVHGRQQSLGILLVNKKHGCRPKCRTIPNWIGYNYIHQTVNHSVHFVDPVTGANTQRIESEWGHVKTKLVRTMRGTSSTLLPGHLAEYWWKKLHAKTPFNDIVAEIARQFPLV